MRRFRQTMLMLELGVASLLGSKRRSAGSLLVTALMLLTIAGASVAAEAVVRTAGRFQEQLAVVAYLRPELTTDERTALQARVEADPRVARALYVSPEEALARLRAAGGRGVAALDALDSNPLPASLEIKPNTAADAPSLVADLSTLPQIEEIINEPELIARVNLLEQGAIILAAILALGALLIALVVLGNAFRLSVAARAKDVVALRLLGASDRMIAGPFLIEAMLISLLGTGVGLLAWQFAAQGIAGMLTSLHMLPLTPLAGFSETVWAGLALGTLLVSGVAARGAALSYARSIR